MPIQARAVPSRPTGRAAQCTAQAIEAVIPARSRTSLECISACSIRLAILRGFVNSMLQSLRSASRGPVHGRHVSDLGGGHHITSVIRERFASAWARHRSHRFVLAAEFQYSSAVGNHREHGQTLSQCSVSGSRIPRAASAMSTTESPNASQRFWPMMRRVVSAKPMSLGSRPRSVPRRATLLAPPRATSLSSARIATPTWPHRGRVHHSRHLRPS